MKKTYYSKQYYPDKEEKKEKGNPFASKPCEIRNCYGSGYQPVEGKVYCYDHFVSLMGDKKRGKYEATPEQTARFLLSMGKSSPFWRYCDPIQREWALAYEVKHGSFVPETPVVKMFKGVSIDEKGGINEL
jgi:hypothetical protein